MPGSCWTTFSSVVGTCTRRSRRCAWRGNTSAASRDRGQAARKARAHGAHVGRAHTGEPADDCARGAQAGRLPGPPAPIEEKRDRALKKQRAAVPETGPAAPGEAREMLLRRYFSCDYLIRYWPPLATFSSS